jgi:hypothetical protein
MEGLVTSYLCDFERIPFHTLTPWLEDATFDNAIFYNVYTLI